LPGCISQGDTAKEAVAVDATWITVALEDGGPIPEPVSDAYSGRFVLRVRKSLHRLLAEPAAKEGVAWTSSS